MESQVSIFGNLQSCYTDFLYKNAFLVRFQFHSTFLLITNETRWTCPLITNFFRLYDACSQWSICQFFKSSMQKRNVLDFHERRKSHWCFWFYVAYSSLHERPSVIKLVKSARLTWSIKLTCYFTSVPLSDKFGFEPFSLFAFSCM